MLSKAYSNSANTSNPIIRLKLEFVDYAGPLHFFHDLFGLGRSSVAQADLKLLCCGASTSWEWASGVDSQAQPDWQLAESVDTMLTQAAFC